MPEVGYTFGGGFDLDAGRATTASPIPAARSNSTPRRPTARRSGSRASGAPYFTVSYVYQGTEIGVNWDANPPSIDGIDPNAKGDITLHKVLFGGRQEFYKSSEQKLRPYIGGGLGLRRRRSQLRGLRQRRVRDALPAVPQRRRALHVRRGEALRPAGRHEGHVVLGAAAVTSTVWCDYWYGCSAYEGSATIAQGTASIGAVIKF
ncbi:MAG: hypothetical protein MZV64_30035 [Ignavibacteriales bacterium]|nr:hypothetical protein [Ignavibacteriales bacterium]